MPKILKQKIVFDVSPKEVYDALINEKKHSAFTGAKAKIDNKVGGKFTAWDDYIDGENIELVPGKKIVQKWRTSDWAVGVYSTVTYELSTVNGGCELTFTQAGIPEENYGEIAQGWIDYYWKPMKKWLKES